MSAPHKDKNKKVSRACNTCRLKRKKCDGQEPCLFCTEQKVECSYSREPRRRGPPSGYLRYTETRVAILETLLGLYIQTAGPQVVESLGGAARKLASQVTTRTQDVWDAYKRSWSDSDAARSVHATTAIFAPFTPAEHQTVKPLLPLPFAKAETPAPGPAHPPPSLPQRSPSPESPFERSALASYSNESFERHQPIQSEPLAPPPPLDLAISPEGGMPTFLPSPHPDVPPSAEPSSSLYMGAYWRTAALNSPSPPFAEIPLPLSPTLASVVFPTAPTTAPLPPELPPPHVLESLIATYRNSVHPSLPILSPQQTADISALDDSPMLLLALCAYTARLAPPPASASRIAADLWYESSSTLLHADLRRATVGPVVVQTLVFLALRDLGRGRDVMAWRGIGAAIRIGVELGLDDVRSPSANPSGATTPRARGPPHHLREESVWTKSLWGVTTLLDLFLSIQLGRPPGSCEALRPVIMFPPSSTNGKQALPPSPPLSSIAQSSPSAPPLVSASVQGSAEDAEAEALLVHTRALVRIVTRIHFCVCLGYADAEGRETRSDAPVEVLRAELAAWHQALPARFRVTLGGGRVPRAVLEAHMLYQVALGMVARATPVTPSEGSDPEADEADADSVSSFNVLLDKYRASLGRAGPHVVWLVFAAARTGLLRAARMNTGDTGASAGRYGGGTARALQMQLYLLNCRDALATMGGTWELARRCAITLERLMSSDGDGGEGAGGSGKRKRPEEGAKAESSSSTRKRSNTHAQDVAGSGLVGLEWDTQLDFAGAWALGNGDDSEMDVGAGGIGWGGGAPLAGLWDERVWGRTYLDGFAANSNGFQTGLGLFGT
ncbi:Nitrogen assimilation transcriptional factor nira [Mycena kentingensis (nom. inval.)]|nr:Nitrogen assimilation transcriptional factor nira [Mycena kentingensis (nom. inval.)]